MSLDQDKKLSSTSEHIIKILIDQLKESSSENSLQIKNLTIAINELIRTITSFPTNKEMLEEFKKHDICSAKRSKEEIDAIYNTCDKNIDNLREVIHEFKNNLDGNKEVINGFEDNLDVKIIPITTCLNEISNKLKTMIIIVCVAFTLMTTSYLFVKNSIESDIDKYIKKIEIDISKQKKSSYK